MNQVLKSKIDELEKAENYECWYLVKQPTAFDNLCYLVSFLMDYKDKEITESLENYISTRIQDIKTIKPNIEISNNYRALRVAAFFGLITMTSSKYEESKATDAFNEIKERCNGEFEKTELYADIIQRQIEKMFISSQIDEAYMGARKEYRLYPVMLLYKILIELGRSTGKYSISMTEYRYIVATTKRFEYFLESLLLIKLLREDETNAAETFETFKSKFDNRLIQALKQLDTLAIDRNLITLKENKIEEVAKKVFIFEENPNVFTTNNYLEFLGSTKSLFDLESNEQSVDHFNLLFETNLESEFSRNRILFGAPGTGKSFTLNKEKDILLKNGGEYERVTFYPDYSYANFVGTYKPVPFIDQDGKEAITYSYVPGPFMRTYVEALKSARTEDPKPYLLIIEEINRANVASVFGDIFQLLDRDSENVSEYPIQTSEDIKNYLSTPENLGGSPQDYSEIRLPDNLFIWATMNSADQGVFPMDTAFKRRWDFTYLGIDESEEGIVGKKVTLGKGDNARVVEWNKLRKAINSELLKYNLNEDKLLGPYFISKKDLPDDDNIDAEQFSIIFKNKVIMYLFDDAAKQKRKSLFSGCKDSATQYSKICNLFDDKGVFIFDDNISSQFIERPGESES